MIIEHPRETTQLRQLWKETFGDEDAFLDAFFSLGYATHRCLCAREGEKVLSAAYWMEVYTERGRYAYVYAVATDRAYRGRGIGKKLLTQAHEVLRVQGYDGVILVPAEPWLFAFYEKLGYERFCNLQEITVQAAPPRITLKELSPEEYMLARRERLPRGGVRQEGAFLAVLASYHRFFAGEDCLLCCYQDGDTGVIPEFWGDREILGAVAAALGVQQVRVRCAGGSSPFAMYLPLKNGEAPSYFALALD